LVCGAVAEQDDPERHDRHHPEADADGTDQHF
jgi:hypothetical protein